MKKIILLAGLFLAMQASTAFAACEYKCVEPYDMNSGFRTFISGVFRLEFCY